MGLSSRSTTAGIFQAAGQQYDRIVKINKEIVEKFPDILVSTGQFQNYELVSEIFRKDKPGSEAEISLNSKRDNGRTTTTSIVLYKDGNVTVSQSTKNPEGGQDNKKVAPWNFGNGGWSAQEVMREIVVRIASIDPQFRAHLAEVQPAGPVAVNE